jgi:hypothetical protein
MRVTTLNESSGQSLRDGVAFELMRDSKIKSISKAHAIQAVGSIQKAA